MVAGVSTLSAFFFFFASTDSLLVIHPPYFSEGCMCRQVYSSVFLDSEVRCALSMSLCSFQSWIFFFLISNFLALWLEKILGLTTVFEKFVETYFVACHMIYPGDFSMCWLRMYIPQLLSRVFFDVAWLDVSLMMFSSLKVESESYTVTVY